MPDITGVHHAAFTVHDVERSSAWCRDLLGVVQVFGGDDDEVSFRVLAHPASGWVMNRRQYHSRPGDGFDELRTGLDHFCDHDGIQLEFWLPVG